MVDIPYENTLTTNSTHQQLIKLGKPFADATVLSPSRVEEGAKGYDIKHEGAKQLEYQYKRAINIVSSREVAPRQTRDCFAYPFDGEQAQTLITRNPVPDAAYYVLPLVETERQLASILDHTVFVDVQGLVATSRRAGLRLDDFSRLYVSDDVAKDVYLKHAETDWRQPNAYHPIPSEFTYTWDAFADRLRHCRAGLLVRASGSATLTDQFRAKQRLDRTLNKFAVVPREEAPSVQEVTSLVNELQSFYDDETVEGWCTKHQEAVEREIEETLDRARSREDLRSRDTIGYMLEFGDEADRLSIGFSG